MNIVNYLVRSFFILKDSILSILVIYITYLILLYILRKIKKNLSQIILEYFFLLYSFTIMKITNIYPLKIEIQDVINGEYVKPNMIPFVNESFRLIVLNLIMFFPFGIFIPKIFSRIEWNFRRIFICMFFITIVIEILQIFGGRMFDIDDIIMNTTGGILGFCVFSNRFFKKKENS